MSIELTDHIEEYLGPVKASWSLTHEGAQAPFKVVRCSDLIDGTNVFCTFGLSNHAFKEVSIGGSPIRHELLIAVPEALGDLTFPAIVQQLGMMTLSRNKPFLFGETIGGTHEVFAGRPFRGFGATSPVFIEGDGFEVFKRADGADVVFVWMVPLCKVEIEFAREKGWSKLEDLIIESDLDLVELDRRCAEPTSTA
jgi:hypothetical protein